MLLSLALLGACQRSPAPLLLLEVKQIPRAPASAVPARRFVGYIDRPGLDIADGCARELVRPSLLLVEMTEAGLRYAGEPVDGLDGLRASLDATRSGTATASAAGCRPWGESGPAVLIAVEPGRSFGELFGVLDTIGAAGFSLTALLVQGAHAPQSLSGKEHALVLSQPEGWYIQDNSDRRAWTVDDSGMRGWLLEQSRARPLGALVVGASASAGLGRVLGAVASARSSGLSCLSLALNRTDQVEPVVELATTPAPTWLRTDQDIDVLPLLMLREGSGDAHLVDGTTCHFESMGDAASYGGAVLAYALVR